MRAVLNRPIFESLTFDPAQWTPIGTPTRTQAAILAGGLPLDLIGDDSGAAFEGNSGTIVFTRNGTAVVDFLIKKSTSVSVLVQIQDTTTIVNRLFAGIAWSGNVPALTVTAGRHVSTQLFDADTDTYLVRLESSPITAANAHQAFVFPVANVASGTGSVYLGRIRVFGPPMFQADTFSSGWAAPVTTPTITPAAVTAQGIPLDLIGDDSVTTYEPYVRSLTFSKNSRHTVSFVAKRGTVPTVSLVAIGDGTAGVNRLDCYVSWLGAVPSISMINGDLVSSTLIDADTDAYLIVARTEPIIAANTHSIAVYPDGSVPSQVGNVYIGRVQVAEPDEYSALEAANFWPIWRVKVQDALGVMRDMTDHQGVNWVDGASFGADIDQPVPEARIQLRRDFGVGTSMAPMVGESALNADGTLIDVARAILIEGGAVPFGVEPADGDYHQLFAGITDDVDWQGDPIEIVARGLEADLVDRFVEARTTYGDADGIAMETVIQSVLNDWGGDEPLLDSQNFASGWSAAGSPTRTGAAITAAGIPMDLLGDDHAVSYEYYSRAVVFTENGSKVIKVELKKGTATSQLIQLYDSTAAVSRAAVNITWNGTVPTSTNPSVRSIVHKGDGRYEITIVAAGVIAANTNIVVLYPAYGSGVPASTGDVYVGRYRVYDTEAALAPPDLYVPVSPSFLITTTPFERISVWEAVQSIAALNGWNLRYVWDDSANAFRLTLFEPARTKASPDWTHAPDRYLDVTRLSLSRKYIRNVVTVTYRDATSGLRASVTVQDNASILRYGRQWMLIEEGDDSPIDSEAEAEALADAALADLKDPKAEQEIQTLFFWPAELQDLYRFAANDVHYDEPQDWAVSGLRHELTAEDQNTFVSVRGSVAGFYRSWIKRSQQVAPEIDPDPAPEFNTPPLVNGLDVTINGNGVCRSIRIERIDGGGTHEVELNGQFGVFTIPVPATNPATTWQMRATLRNDSIEDYDPDTTQVATLDFTVVNESIAASTEPDWLSGTTLAGPATLGSAAVSLTLEASAAPPDYVAEAYIRYRVDGGKWSAYQDITALTSPAIAGPLDTTPTTYSFTTPYPKEAKVIGVTPLVEVEIDAKIVSDLGVPVRTKTVSTTWYITGSGGA